MLRKLCVVAVAIAMPVGLIAATGEVAGAVTTGPAAADSIVCHDVTGTLHFSRPLTTKGYTSGVIVTTLSATLTDCATSGHYHVKGLTKGTTTGTFTSATGSTRSPIGSCASMVRSSKETGTLKSVWNTSALTAYPSKISVKSDIGGATPRPVV